MARAATFSGASPTLLELARRGALSIRVDRPEGKASVVLVPAETLEAIELFAHRGVALWQRDEMRDKDTLQFHIRLVSDAFDDHAKQLLVWVAVQTSSKEVDVQRRAKRSRVVERRAALRRRAAEIPYNAASPRVELG